MKTADWPCFGQIERYIVEFLDSQSDIKIVRSYCDKKYKNIKIYRQIDSLHMYVKIDINMIL